MESRELRTEKKEIKKSTDCNNKWPQLGDFFRFKFMATQ